MVGKFIDDAVSKCIQQGSKYASLLEGKLYCSISADYYCPYQGFSADYLKYCSFLNRQYERRKQK